MNLSICSDLPTENLSHVTSENTALYTAWAYMFIVLSAFVIFANAIVIISLLRSHFKDQSGATTNVRLVKSLMTSMAVSDAIIGAFSMPLGIYELFKSGHWELGDNLCEIKQITDVFLCTVSIYHVICMAVDRYLAVCRPFLYRTLTMRTSGYMIGVCWAAPGILCLILFLNDWNLTGVTDVAMCLKMNDYCIIILSLPHQIVSVTISFYIPFVVMYVLYFLIAREVWKVYSRSPQFRGRFSLRKGPSYRGSTAQTLTICEDICDNNHDSKLSVKCADIPNEDKGECCQSIMDAKIEEKCMPVISPRGAFPNRSYPRDSTRISILKTLKRFSPRPGARKLSSSRELEGAANSSSCKKDKAECNPLFKIGHCERANQMEACSVGHNKPTICVLDYGTGYTESANHVVANETDNNKSTNNEAAFTIGQIKPTNRGSVCDIDHSEPINHVEAYEIGQSELANQVEACERSNNELTNREAIFTSNPTSLFTQSEERPLPATSSPSQSTLQVDTPSSCEVLRACQNYFPHKTQISPPELSSRWTRHEPTPSPKASPSPKPNSRSTRPPNERPSTGLTNMKAVWTIGSVVVCFTLCWLPFSIHVVVLSYFNYSLPMWHYHLWTWLGYVNSALNPLLYCCNKSIREAVKSLFFPTKSNAHL